MLEHLNIWLKQHKHEEIAKTLQLRDSEKSCITGLLKPKVEQASLKYVCKEQRDPASDTPAYVMVPLDIVAVYEGKEYALDNEACKELLPATRTRGSSEEAPDSDERARPRIQRTTNHQVGHNLQRPNDQEVRYARPRGASDCSTKVARQ